MHIDNNKNKKDICESILTIDTPDTLFCNEYTIKAKSSFDRKLKSDCYKNSIPLLCIHKKKSVLEFQASTITSC